MNLPNLLTLFRIVLAGLFLFFLLQSDASFLKYAVIIFTIAALTDALDGFLARLWHQQTELGSFLDPVADKVLILSGFLGILLTAQAVFKLPNWFQAMILFRELVIIIGVVTLFLFTGKIHNLPNKLGKVTTVIQLLLVASCLLNWPGTMVLAYVTAILTVASCIVYVEQGMRKF